MTERGLPIVDGAPACPFVAFEDDRDERAASPDYRHRCYAEARPAPRALAHQEAYCLSSAFPVCPTFQDWARREAARSRADGPRQPEEEPSGVTAMSQRNPPRNWSAPPPWAAGGAAGAGAWAEEGEGGEDLPPGGRGLSGSYADRVASGTASGTSGGATEGEPPGDDRDEDDEGASGFGAAGFAGAGGAALAGGAAAASAGSRPPDVDEAGQFRRGAPPQAAHS